MVISDSSFGSARIVLMFSASSSASLPRRIVPLMGQVSTRIPFAFLSARTNISGDAPTSHSSSPKLMQKPYGEGFRCCRRVKTALGLSVHGSRKVWDRTASKRSPRANFCFATSTSEANSPGWNSRFEIPSGISDRPWKGTSVVVPSRPLVQQTPPPSPNSLNTKSYFMVHACWPTWLTTRSSSGMYSTRSRAPGSRFWCMVAFSNWKHRS
mmetsp:Transcript_57880/g.152388  ORF Transcript_57880/g.152388 Transcript_57880/m.152388 type:complete len:211 (-) Transcript_57880:697-1329(-)